MKNEKLRFKRFIRASFLRRLGRPLLRQLLGRFVAELALPGDELPDETFFCSLARALSSPEALPQELAEALFAIDEMSGPEGQQQLEAAAARAGLTPILEQESTRSDLAVRVWLADPGLLARVHNQQRLRRLSAFECFGPAAKAGRAPFTCPDETMLARLAAALDPWFGRHQRGHNTTRLELYPIAGDYWFLVRHGDTFTRTPTVEAQRTEIIHFRPERDDVVVYSPQHDELRINAQTRGERRLYVEVFGAHLHGAADWFSRRRTYTLEPLRSEGPDSLDASGLEGLSRIVLRELELTSDAAPREVLTREAENLFRMGACAAELMPPGWRVTRAGFELHFTGQIRPRPVQIRPPNLLKLGRHCDLKLVDQWLCQRGFRVVAGSESL
jgi:hypothetical protein